MSSNRLVRFRGRIYSREAFTQVLCAALTQIGEDEIRKAKTRILLDGSLDEEDLDAVADAMRAQTGVAIREALAIVRGECGDDET